MSLIRARAFSEPSEADIIRSVATELIDRGVADPGEAYRLAAQSSGRSFAEPASPPPRYQAGAAYGSDGETYDSWGYLYSGGPDVNPILSGRNKFWIYNEMRRSDPMIKSLLWMFKLPIRAASWMIEDASDDPADKMVGDAVRWQFGLEGEEGELDQTWDASLQQSMLFLDWGCMCEEIIWGEVTEWRDANDTMHLVKPIARLAPRMPITVEQIYDDPATGLITGIKQDNTNGAVIPGDKLIWYVLEKEGRNWFGTSMLRPTYGAWRLKKQLQIAAGIAWDRFGAGVPLVRYPEEGGATAEAKAEAIGANIRTHERAWIALAGAKPPAGDWDVEILSPSGTLPDPVNLLRHYDGQISQAGLQMFTRLGTTETGSRAVGDTLGEPFYMAAQALASDLAMQRQKYVIRRFVDVNFGEDIDVPKLTVSKIMSRNIAELAQAAANLASAGLSFTDVEAINSFRDALEIPELPEALADALDALPPDTTPLTDTPPTPVAEQNTTEISPPASTSVPTI